MEYRRVLEERKAAEAVEEPAKFEIGGHMADAGEERNSSGEENEEISLAVESHEVHEDIVNVSDISQQPLKLEVRVIPVCYCSVRSAFMCF